MWRTLILLAVAAKALAPGDPLPPIRGELLSGKTAELPAAARGHVALLALGFAHASNHAVEAWTKRFRQEFGRDPDVTAYQIPVVGGMGKLGKPFMMRGMRKDTPKADYDHFLVVFNDAGEWKQRVNFKAPNDAYLILIDAHGIVRWLGSGSPDEHQYSELREAAKKLRLQNQSN